MKKLLILIPVLALAVSCGDKDDDGIKGGRLALKASQIANLPAEGQIARVKLMDGNSDRELAASPWDNGFSLLLPEDLGSVQMRRIIHLPLFGGLRDGLDESYHEAKGTTAFLSTHSADETITGYFEQGKTGPDSKTTVIYLYSDSPLKLKSENSWDYDYGEIKKTMVYNYEIDLRKGWNLIVEIVREEGDTNYASYSTHIPSGLSWSYIPRPVQ